MKTFLNYVWILIFVYMPLAVAIFSAGMFFINDKRIFLKYFIVLANMLLSIISVLLLSMSIYPNGDERFGYVFEILFFSGSFLLFTIMLSIKLLVNSKNNAYRETHLFYLKSRLGTVLKSLLITLVVLFALFQLFLLWSACNAYEKAKELGHSEYSIISFYSPFVKPIEFDGKRYSYHRARYVDMHE